MKPSKNTKDLRLGLLTLILLIVTLISLLYSSHNRQKALDFQTADAGTTTDSGTSTSNIDESDLQTFASSTTGISFKYPQLFSLNYIQTVDWPPAIVAFNDVYQCTQAGAIIAPGGQTVLKSIHGTSYCVTTEGEGAAGSVYNQYAYAFKKSGVTLILTFTLRYPQCVNYPEPKMTACKAEESSFSVDNLADEIAGSAQYKMPQN